MYKKDEMLCRKLLQAAEKITIISRRFSALEEFQADSISFDAAMMNFIVIGEMANKLSEEFKRANSDIEWREVINFRNLIAHDYFGIDAVEVWQIIKDNLPALKEKMHSLLA